MLYQVFTAMINWFVASVMTFLEHGGYLGMAIFVFPILRKVCYIFKQLTN